MEDLTIDWMDGVFYRAQSLWGREVQEIKAIEELAELTQAIIKNQQRHKNGNNQDNLLEEIADVEIMLWQLKRFNGFKQEDIDKVKFIKVQKLDKLIDKINKQENTDNLSIADFGASAC